MQENEFEKRVREMMEEFKISPRDTVWAKVEQHIPRQKRRRRWMIFIFLLTGLIVSGYFVYNNFYNDLKKSENVVVKNQGDKSKDNVSDNKKVDHSQTPVIKQENQIVNNIDKEKNNSAVLKNGSNKIISSDVKDEQSLNEQIKDVTSVTIERDRQPADQKKIIDESNVQPNISDDTSRHYTAVTDEGPEEQKNAVNMQGSKDSAETAMPITSNKKQTQKTKANKNWQFGITAFYGRSDMFENLLGIKLNSAPANYNADPSTVSGFPRNPVTVSKDIKAKGAFSLGVAVKKNFSSKSNLTIGLQYSEFQTEIETGVMEDSVAVFRFNNLSAAPAANLNTYYKPGAGYPRKNSYSFIQVPVIYEHSITKNKLLNWNAGASLSRLVTSNALVYDSYNQAYYHNNDLFRKTHITLLAGANTQFNLGQTLIHFGPQFQYGLTNLFKRNDYGSEHLFSWGLQAKIFLKK